MVMHVCFNTDFTCVFQHRRFELCMYVPRLSSWNSELSCQWKMMSKPLAYTKSDYANDLWFSESIGRPNVKPLAQTLSSKTLAIHKHNSESIGTPIQNPLADQMWNHWHRPLVRKHWQSTNTIQNPLAHQVWNLWHDVEYIIQQNLK
jgi:hypothetical protein